MKRIFSLAITLFLILTALPIVGSAETKTLVAKESEWEYLVYDTSDGSDEIDPPEGWLTNSDTDVWAKDQAPFAGFDYAKSISNTVFDFSLFNAYLRLNFNVENLSEISAFEMQVIYDEDPVVYLNGEELWSAQGYKDASYLPLICTTALNC